MSEIRLKKYQGLGNDYLVYDAIENGRKLTDRQAELLCRRNFGVGADGICCGTREADGTFRAAIYNPDGSEAAYSGNGVSIFAKYLWDAGYVQEKKLRLLTAAGETEVEFVAPEEGTMTVTIGKAEFMSDKIPVACVGEREWINEPMQFAGKWYNATCLSVGNPNCVIMTEDVTAVNARKLGPYVENADCFPDRMNLQLCHVTDRKTLKVETYERGAGYTKSSGTGACAAAATAYRLGLADRNVTVEMPGGSFKVEIQEDGTIRMSGKVEFVGDIVVEEQFFA